MRLKRILANLVRPFRIPVAGLFRNDLEMRLRLL